jgi:hypothetical protein
MGGLRRSWIAAVLIGIGLFALCRSSFHRALLSSDMSDPKVGVETIDGYSQIWMESGGKKTVLTKGSINSHMPAVCGDYVAWVQVHEGAGQIQLTHIPTKSKLSLTFLGTNVEPDVDCEGRVVWKRFEDESWAIYGYDGTDIRKLSTEAVAKEAHIVGNSVEYKARDKSDWKRKVVQF